MKIGVDLGTSYSSAAALVNGKIETIRVATGASAFGDSFSMPTAVYLDNGHMLFGQAALSKKRISPASFKSEFKRDFGTATPYIISGEEYLPEHFYTEIFLYFKEQAVKQTGEKIEKAYITHPANYGNNKKRLIEKAANNAGLFDVVLVDEPTAAAAGYSQKNKIENGDILLVYDLGGGTFDTAIIKKTSNGYVHLTEPLGISKCGGVDFDRVIFDDIINKMGKTGEFDIERLVNEKRFTASLSEVCIQIKHQLSHVESHTEPIAIGAYDYFEYTITRAEFEEMIHPLIASTCEKVKDILKNSGLAASDIDRVLLVGGSSLIPLVQRMMCETMEKEVSFDADPELAVCQGAVSLDMENIREDSDEEKRIEEKEKDIVQDSSEEKMESAEGTRLNDDKTKEKIKAEPENRIMELLKAESSDFMKELMADVILGKYASDGEWIYYIEKKILCKIRIDGTGKTPLSNNEPDCPVKTDGEWVYYRGDKDSEWNWSLCRIRKDGTGKEVINKEIKVNRKEYVIKDGWIYFIDSSTYLKRMRTDGTDIMQLSSEKGIEYITMGNNWIYYCDSHKLYRVCEDGTKKSVITSCKNSIEGISIHNDWIFCSSYDVKSLWIIDADIFSYELWKIKQDGIGKITLQRGLETVPRIKTINEILYYEKEDKGIRRMNLDGTFDRLPTYEELKQELLNFK